VKTTQYDAAYAAEEALCAALVLCEDSRDEVLPYIDLDDLISGQVRAIIRAMRGLYNDSRPVDPVTLSDALTNAGQWGTLVRAADFARILATQAVAGHAAHYHQIVRDAATIRTAAEAGQRIAKAAHEATTADDVRSEATAALETILSREAEKDSRSWAEVVTSTLALLEERAAAPGADLMATTGISTLDAALTGGFRAGQLIVLAARPSVGKSSLATQIAWSAAGELDKPAMFVSLEMSGEEVAERIFSQQTDVHLASIRDGRVTNEERRAIVDFAGRWSAAPLTVLDKSRQGIRGMIATAKRVQRRGGLSVIVIDYLQLIVPDDERLMREQQVARMTRALKIAAKDLGVPIVLLCQLNRGSEKESRDPRLSDLRESGAIEQDADVVMILHRRNLENREAVTCSILKQRSGPPAHVELKWIGAATKFAEPDAASVAKFEEFREYES
jgi:replicative DNA helicase